MSLTHETVLLEEAVAALMPTSALSGVFVDGTFGRGGHSLRILQGLSPQGRLVAFDKDPEAAELAARVAANDPRFAFIHGTFADLEAAGGELAGVLLDLGVSSPQLDDADRGFSFMHDGPLDMRMDTRSGETAADFINGAEEVEIAQVLRDYGEERFARRIAAAIVKARESAPFVSTSALARTVAEANPAWEKHKHPATRSFQALRIRVNRELADLELLLEKVIDLLMIGGRLVVISFHSLEDRLVKRFMRDGARGKPIPRGVPVRAEELDQRLRIIGKAVRAGDDEVARNPRARSAIMRVAERIR